MPKMKADYFAQKRNEILDAAFAVCMKNPLHEVSMRDIISEVGFSQGNIYRYFSNFDEILIALINRGAIDYDVKSAVDEAIVSDKLPEKVIKDIIGIWDKAILDSFLGTGKILYEVTALYANDKERMLRFISGNIAIENQTYLKEKFFAFIHQKVNESYFNPKQPLEDIFNLFIVSIDGIIRNLIISTFYNIMPEKLQKDAVLNSLYVMLILLLGGDET